MSDRIELLEPVAASEHLEGPDDLDAPYDPYDYDEPYERHEPEWHYDPTLPLPFQNPRGNLWLVWMRFNAASGTQSNSTIETYYSFEQEKAANAYAHFVFDSVFVRVCFNKRVEANEWRGIDLTGDFEPPEGHGHAYVLVRVEMLLVY